MIQVDIQAVYLGYTYIAIKKVKTKLDYIYAYYHVDFLAQVLFFSVKTTLDRLKLDQRSIGDKIK